MKKHILIKAAMNLPTDLDSMPLNLHFLLQQTAEGQVVASVAELADCQVRAATREEAIAQLQTIVRDRLAGVEVVPIEFAVETRADNPWVEFIGMYEGDADFAEIAAELRSERELDDLEMAP